MYGLGGLPEGFSRLSAIYGGTYMLNKPVDEIIYGKDGKVTGVRAGGETAKCKKVIGDPSYFLNTDKVKKVGLVARCIALMSHPIPNTSDANSCQIIIPAATQPGRKSDIYVCVTSFVHHVAANGKYVAVASCPVETKDAKQELEPALKLLGGVDEVFFWTSDVYVPTSDGTRDNVFITQSYDASTHFEADTREVLALYARFMGKPLDLTVPPKRDEDGEQQQTQAH